MSPELVLGRLMASLAESVKVITGGPVSGEELLMLPSQWKGCYLLRKNTEIFTRFVDEDASQPDVARYCGSGTSKIGLHSQLTAYERTSR